MNERKNILAVVFLFCFTAYVFASSGNEGRVIQKYLQWNYTHMNKNCSTASGRNICQDIRICKFASAAITLGGWPTLCGWVANTVPKVCCGLPLVLGKTLMERVDAEKARKRECGKTMWGPKLSDTENKFFEIVATLPDVDTSNPDEFDPPLDLSIETMVSPVGGVPSRQGDFPWMVSIRQRGKHLCGGSLIDRRHILSASHCFDDEELDPNLYMIHIGNIKVDEGYPVGVKKILLHEGYVPSQYYNDIAILTMEKEILNPFAAHICLPSPEMSAISMDGRNTTLLGWGDTSYGGKGTSVLHIVDDIPVVPNDECRKAYRRVGGKGLPGGVTKEFICAGLSEGGKDACQSDSGGPLMYRYNSDTFWNNNPWILIGVVSFGFRCGLSGFPGVYTRVTSHLNWIEEHTKN